MRRLHFSIRSLLLLIAVAAVSIAYWLNTTYSFSNDLSYWPATIPADLEGQQIRIFGKAATGACYEFTRDTRILNVDHSDIANVEITIRVTPWQKWKMLNSKVEHLAWYCPYYIRGGSIEK